MGAKEFAFTAAAIALGVIIATVAMKYIPQIGGSS